MSSRLSSMRGMNDLDTLDRAVLARSTPAMALASPRARRLETCWARHLDDVRAAQRLRFEVFAVEMGARLSVPDGTPPGLDVDRFDDHCEHLLVRTSETRDAPSEVIGTYRVLTPAGARRVGGLYSDAEFDLTSLDALRPRLAELGRTCTATAWRQGGVILMLWSSLAEFMHRTGLDLMAGSASVPMRDGGHAAASLWARLQRSHLAPAHLRVHPRLPLPACGIDSDMDIEPPPLIKGYLRCGARVLGAPAWDPAFGMADMPMLLDFADLPEAYRSRFVKS